MKQIILIAIALMLVGGEVGAIDSKNHYGIIGQGTQSCGAWTSDLRKGGVDYIANRVWIVGFVTGYNAFVPGKYDVAEGTDARGIWGWWV